MKKAIYYKLSNGIEIIDNTPEAEIRLSSLEYLEERTKRERSREAEQKRKLAKNPLWKLACMCGIV